MDGSGFFLLEAFPMYVPLSSESFSTIKYDYSSSSLAKTETKNTRFS